MALMMPKEDDCPTLRGLPMASTMSPVCGRRRAGISRWVRLSASIFSSARLVDPVRWGVGRMGTWRLMRCGLLMLTTAGMALGVAVLNERVLKSGAVATAGSGSD